MTQDSENNTSINGVFSTQETRKVGTGMTSRKTVQKVLWFCKEVDTDSIEIQPINLNFIPSGTKKFIDKETFFSNYSPEPEAYVNSVLPKINQLNKIIAKADRHRGNGELYTAEMEYNDALKLDLESVRANFGLGITYLERGEKSKAENVFGRIVKLDSAFEEQYKHLFNEFGISLRKNKMLEESISYYKRALEICKTDANIYHNLARVELEAKNIPAVIDNLVASLEIDPKLDASIKFLTWLITNKLVPEQCKPKVANILQKLKGSSA